jgi:hypothetical protein
LYAQSMTAMLMRGFGELIASTVTRDLGTLLISRPHEVDVAVCRTAVVGDEETCNDLSPESAQFKRGQMHTASMRDRKRAREGVRE